MKTKRHRKILELIKENVVGTQEELADLLKQDGFAVTQATVSRDIRELGLYKVVGSEGRQKYAALKEKKAHLEEKYIRVFQEGCVSMDMAQNILVIKTVSGMAMAVAASLDAIGYPEIVGTIAGDDTIMCAVRSVEDTERVMEKLRRMIGQKA